MTVAPHSTADWTTGQLRLLTEYFAVPHGLAAWRRYVGASSRFAFKVMLTRHFRVAVHALWVRRPTTKAQLGANRVEEYVRYYDSEDLHTAFI